MPDVREMLERSAAEPAGGPDMDAILGRARTLDRRRKAAWVAAPALVLLAALVAAPGLVPRPSVLLGPGTGDRDAFDLPEAGEVRPEFLGDNTPVFVVGDEHGAPSIVEAFDAGELWGMRQMVGWCPRSGMFEDPLRGSRYTPAGDWIAGPAPAGLATYDAIVDGTLVAVGQRRQGAPRRDMEFVPAGPACEAVTADYVLHPPPRPLTPEEAAAANPSGWVAVEGFAVHTEGDMPRLCSNPRGQPPSCPADAPVTHGVEPRPDDLRWRMLEGRFLAQFEEGDVVALAMWYHVTAHLEEQADVERVFGYIQEIRRAEGGHLWLDLVPAQWISDPTAPNDYRIELHEEPLRSYRLAERVEVFGDTQLTGREPGRAEVGILTLLEAGDIDSIPFWVTVERGTWTVVRIEEQYVP